MKKFLAVGATLPCSQASLVCAQTGMQVQTIGQYGGGGAAVVGSPNGGFFVYFDKDVNNPCASGPGTRLAFRLDIAGTHSRRKELMNLFLFAKATGTLVTVSSGTCLANSGFAIPTISDAAGSVDNVYLQ